MLYPEQVTEQPFTVQWQPQNDTQIRGKDPQESENDQKGPNAVSTAAGTQPVLSKDFNLEAEFHAFL